MSNKCQMANNFATDIVKNTFEQGFDRDRFYRFIKELLNKFDESKAFHAHGYVKEKFKETTKIVKTYERLGTYIDPEGNKIDILIVYLEKKNSLDRARTTLRNFVADYLRQRDMKEAALVAFVSPDLIDWRFSLVKMEYKIFQTPSRNIKAKEEFTPAKRFSFLVGPEEHTHTAQSRLAPIIQDDVNNPTLKELEDAFSVEKVTKEFFEKYRDLYLELKKYLDELIEKETSQKIKKEFEAKEIKTIVFCKKLLGQIVFLYFLQKKGWLGAKEKWGDGNKKFLRNLFIECKCNNKNFFNDYLEYLFYDALNNERRGSVDSSIYSKFNCKIPFLNGGLFDNDYDWQTTNIEIGNELFSNRKDEGDEGSGILDLFDLYNFTVKEDEPLEKEVAIDPEMLGKVFENLLEVKDRKSKGTYYTPREIIHYMCQQSLINYLTTELDGKVNKKAIEFLILKGEEHVEYLETANKKSEEKEDYKGDYKEKKHAIEIKKYAKDFDDLLSNIKVCDPAIGSGAFLIGMMNELVKARMVLRKIGYITGKAYDEKGNEVINFQYWYKKQAIQNSLYGVDIDLGAVEIAKLRLWLSLIVDEDDITQIKPLPNLDYKIMQGNSLIEFGSPSLIVKGNDEEKNILIDSYLKLKDRYFFVSNHEEKQALFHKINDLILNLAVFDKNKRLEIQKNVLMGFKAQTKLFGPMEGENLSFDDTRKEVRQQEKIVSQTEKDIVELGTDHFEWHLYFSGVFKKGGFDVVIANPPYVRADSKDPNYQTFRRTLEKSGRYKTLYEKWDLFIPFVERGLNLLNEKGDLNFIVSNAICTSKYAFKLLDLIQENYFVVSVDYFENIQVFDAGVIPVVLHVSKDPINQPVKKTIRSGSFDNIVSKAKYKSEDFKLLGKQGFKKDYHAINIKVPIYKLGVICYISKGMVLNSDESTNKGAFAKNDLISEVKTDINTKPYIEGKYLKKYLIEKILFLEWNTKRVPHLLSRPTFPELYNRPKIMRGRVTEGTYDDTGLVSNDSILLFLGFADLKGINNNSIAISIQKFNSHSREELENISLKFDLKYLLAIINSKFANVYLNNIRRHRLENYFYPDDFRNLPIAEIPLSEQKPLVDLADKIISLKKSCLEKDKHQALDYEKQIDQMVYKLYGLTPEEIAIVEK